MALVDYECDSDSDNENDFICVVFTTLPKEGEESENDEDNNYDHRENDANVGKRIDEKNNTVVNPEENNIHAAAAINTNVANDNKRQSDSEQGDKKCNDDKTSIKRMNAIKQPVRIEIPPVPIYNSDDEEPPKKIIKKITEKASGLFSLLPSPKATAVENQKFDANIVKQKNLIPRNIKTNLNDTKQRNDSDDDEISNSDFFSINDMKKVNSSPAIVSSSLNIQVDSARPVKDTTGKSNSFFANLVADANKIEINPEPAEEPISLEANAVEELCGKRQKKARKNDVKFIDINADDVMPGHRQWQTKALTEEGPTAVKKGEEPSQQSRRKHQITYLAYQAKMNEQELQNQWAHNRMTRKQTQAKYGF